MGQIYVFVNLLRRTSLHEVVILFAIISAFGLQMVNFADDPGVGWHLETGRLVIEDHAVPDIDPFLGGGIERQWISDQWLSDVLLFSLFRIGSWPLVYAVLGLLYLSIYVCVLYRGIRGLGAPALASTFAVMLAFKAGQIHFILRPVMFSFAFFSLVYLHLLNEEKREDTESPHLVFSARTTMLYLLGFAVWANMHPGFVLGLFLLTVHAVLTSAKVLFKGLSAACVVRSLIFLIAATLGTLINPYGITLHQSILSLQQSSYFMNLHEEWLPIALQSPEGELWIATIAILILGIVLGRGKNRVGTVLSISVTCIFAAACFDAVRMIPFFGIAASYPVTCALVALGNNPRFSVSAPFIRIKNAFSFFEQRELKARTGNSFFLAASFAILLSSIFRGNLLLFHGPFGPHASKYPYQGVETLKSLVAQAGAKSWTVASGAEWGGFITLIGNGLLRPVIDDRNTLVGEEFYREYEERVEHAVKWQTYLDAREVDAVLLPPTRLLSHAIRLEPLSGWTIVLSDSLQQLAVRKSARLIRVPAE